MKSKLNQNENVRVTTKLLLAGGILLFYFLIYFGSAFLERSYYYDPSISLDSLIPVIPFFIIFYLAADIFIFLPILMINKKRQYLCAMLGYFIILLISGIIFLIAPTVITRPEVTGTGVIAWLNTLQYTIDPQYNAFPSLHVSLSFFSFMLIKEQNRKLGDYFLPFLILIILSTLFVKQHVVLDALGGLVLGAFAFLIFKELDSGRIGKVRSRG